MVGGGCGCGGGLGGDVQTRAVGESTRRLINQAWRGKARHLSPPLSATTLSSTSSYSTSPEVAMEPVPDPALEFRSIYPAESRHPYTITLSGRIDDHRASLDDELFFDYILKSFAQISEGPARSCACDALI